MPDFPISIDASAKENVSNKSTSVNTDQASNAKYPSVKAVFDWVVNLLSGKVDKVTGKGLSENDFTDALKVTYDDASAWVTDVGLDLASRTTNTNTGDETNTTIKSKLGITTLSGSNTGDETQSSILSKLGWFVHNRVSESTAVTGTTTEAIIENIKINANTFVSGGILRSYNNKFRKVGTAGSLTVRLYISPNNNSLTGANQIAIASIPAANLFAELLRTFTATTTSLIGWNSAVSTTSDVTISTNARTETAVTWANDQYFIITVQLSNAGDSVSLIGASLKNF